jgi:hypothetical protein
VDGGALKQKVVFSALVEHLTIDAERFDSNTVTEAEQADAKLPSVWVLMARHEKVLAEFLSDPPTGKF